VLLLFCTPPLFAADLTCHIHPPGVDLASDPAAFIGPFQGRSRCETQRRQRFGPDGRCHCSFVDGSPWRRFGEPAFPGSRGEAPWAGPLP
jgi:hypothetical protein